MTNKEIESVEKVNIDCSESNNVEENNDLNVLELHSTVVENQLTSTNIVQSILKLVPKENEPNDGIIEDCRHIVFMIEGNIGFLAGYTSMEPNSNKAKFGVDDLSKVNLKSMKLDPSFNLTLDQQRSLSCLPNKNTSYSFEQIMTIYNCYMDNKASSKFNYPKEPGLYMIIECTKQWIKYIRAPSYGKITKVLTMPLLISYHNSGLPSNREPCPTVFSQPVPETNLASEESSTELSKDSVDNQPDVFDPSMKKKNPVKFKDGFITFNEGEYPLNDMTVQKATSILTEVIVQADSSPLKYYVTDGHRVTSRYVSKLWAQFFETKTFTDICPEYTVQKRRKYNRIDSFRTSAQISVLKALYTVICNQQYFHSKSDIPNGSKEEIVGFREKWVVFHRTMMALKPLNNKTVNNMCNADLSKYEKQKSLNHEIYKLNSRTNHRPNRKLLGSDTGKKYVLPEWISEFSNSTTNQDNGSIDKSTDSTEHISRTFEIVNQSISLHYSAINNVITDMKNELRLQREEFIKMKINYENDYKRMKTEIKRLKNNDTVSKHANVTLNTSNETSESDSE